MYPCGKVMINALSKMKDFRANANYGNTVVDAEHLDSIAHSGSLRSRSGSEFAIHSNNDSAAADNYNRCYGVGLDRGKDDQNTDPEAECIVYSIRYDVTCSSFCGGSALRIESTAILRRV
jgi:hypothetical protein